MAETNDGVVELVCKADPGGNELQVQDRELASPAWDPTLRWLGGQKSSHRSDVRTSRDLSCHVTSLISRDLDHGTWRGSNPPFQNPGYAHEADVDADSSCNSRSLTENDVAGASLNGKDPTRLTIPQLKRWLLCRDASTKGKKVNLVARSVQKFKAM